MTFTASEVKCLELNMDLDKIAASGQCFRWTPAPFPGGYIVPAGGYCATIYRLDGKIVVHEHTISHHNTLDPASEAARSFWENYLDGAGFFTRWADLEYYLAREPESYIARAASAAYGMQILRQPRFETLISFIVSQNNNIPRIKASVEALCRRHGSRHYVPTARGNFPGAEWWDFPEPWLLTDPATLQGLGLGYRDEYVAAAARAVVSGDLDLGLLALCPYEEARARLKALPGVGDKVADCVCLYGLGHVEAFPVDVHIRRVLEREFPEGFPFEHFPGYAGFVQQLLFYYEREHTAEYRPK